MLPLAAACLLVLAGAQLALWWWKYSGAPLEPLARPFTNIARLHPQAQDDDEHGEPIHIVTHSLPQNLQFGDRDARVIVTIYNDPACGACRATVKRWLDGVPVRGVKLVYKFWPADSERLTGGLLVQLARRQGVVGEFWQRLQARQGDFDDATLLSLLDASGLPLAKQRELLARDSQVLTDALEPDLANGKANHLPPPPVVAIDDVLVDGEILNPRQLALYVKRRLNGEPLVRDDDFWLMQK